MQVHSVKLKRLPEGMSFPEELKDRVAYDAVRKRIEFRGFMTKSDYDRLTKLSNDLHYERSVEELFVAASYDSPRRSPWVVLGVAGVLAAVGVSIIIWYVRQ